MHNDCGRGIMGTTKEMQLELNKQNQTAFVITGRISKVAVDDKVSFNVQSQIAKPNFFNNGVTVVDQTTAMFMEFPKAIGKKILENLNCSVKITIELTSDKDYT